MFRFTTLLCKLKPVSERICRSYVPFGSFYLAARSGTSPLQRHFRCDHNMTDSAVNLASFSFRNKMTAALIFSQLCIFPVPNQRLLSLPWL